MSDRPYTMCKKLIFVCVALKNHAVGIVDHLDRMFITRSIIFLMGITEQLYEQFSKHGGAIGDIPW